MGKLVLKTDEEIELIRESALIASKTLGMLAKEIRPGISTKKLDKLAQDFICDNGATPGFLGLYDYPNTLCTSVNEQVVHGLPSDKPLNDGDIVSVDCGVLKNGFYGDLAFTFAVGNITSQAEKLIAVCKEAMYRGIQACTAGNRIGDIAHAVQSHVESNRFSVVRELTGHGLGKNLHESPHVPNFGKRGSGKKIPNGLVLAIEPMINIGKKEVIKLQDGWTMATKDNKLSAHFEHDVAVCHGTPVLLSTYRYIYSALGTSSDEEVAFSDNALH